MADIARHGGGGRPVPIRDVAERQQLSRHYLAQLAMPLRDSNLIKSVWGQKGGFLLTRPAGEIRLLDIVEAVDGPVGIADCVLDPNYCDRVATCDCFGVFCAINRKIASTLNEFTLQDMLAGQ
jgi:Rrf2 family protein